MSVRGFEKRRKQSLGMAETMWKNEQSLDPILVDMLFEILLRLPAKYVARFLCVSKFWATIIAGRDFNRSYSLRSSPQIQPRLLFAFTDKIKGYQENWHFFSKSTHVSTPLCPVLKPEPGLDSIRRARALSYGGVKKPLVVEEPPDFVSSTVCHLKKLRYQNPCYVHGLISFLYGEEQVVCNPSTGISITLPTVQKSSDMIVRSFLGYDPIHAQYKVLCLTNVKRFCDHHVLTLGPRAQTQNCCSWRVIQCSIPPHYPGTDSVCIDGVLYYSASASHTMEEPFLVGFDLRSENLEIASVFPQGLGSFSETNLINYHGKLALVTQANGNLYHGKVALVTQANGDFYPFYLWVLQDAKKQEWSKEYICFHTGVTGSLHCGLEILGTSDMGEIIFAPINFEELVVYFLDHKSNRIRRVVLEGTPKHKFRDFCQVFTFLHYVESVLFI